MKFNKWRVSLVTNYKKNFIKKNKLHKGQEKMRVLRKKIRSDRFRNIGRKKLVVDTM